MDQINQDRRWYRVSVDGTRIDALTVREVAMLPESQVTRGLLFTCALSAALTAYELRRLNERPWDADDVSARPAMPEVVA